MAKGKKPKVAVEAETETKAVREAESVNPADAEPGTQAKSALRPWGGSNIKAELAHLQTEFDAIVTATETAVKAEDGARKSLYKSLEQLFEFGTKLFADMELTKAFVQENKEPWNKKAKEKPFQALVKIAFKNTSAGEASRSKYTAVLQHALKAKTADQSFGDWIDATDGKLETRYKEAQGQPLGERSTQYNEEVKQARIADGERKVAAEKISTPVEIDAPDLQDSKYGYATALVRVLEDGKIEVVRILESGREEVIHVMHDIGDRPRALRETLQSKPLFRLFRAIELVSHIGDTPGKNHSNAIIIKNSRVFEKNVCEVIFAATMYDFAWSYARIVGHEIPFPPDTTLVLSKDDALRFVKCFANEGEYSLDSSVISADLSVSVTLSHSKEDSQSVQLLPYTAAAFPDLRVAQWPDHIIQPVAFGRPTADAIEGWDREAKAYWKTVSGEETIDRKSRSIAAVFVENIKGADYLRMSLPSVVNIAANLCAVSPGFTIPQKRFVRTAVLGRLSEMVKAYGLTLDGGIADGPQPDNQPTARLALSETFEDGDELRVVMPFVVSIKGDYAKCCVRLEAAYPAFGASPPALTTNADAAAASE